MNPEAILRYLSASAFKEARGEAASLPRSPFITLSREAGAGGRSLAEALLAAMRLRPGSELLRGWEAFDRELCRLAAEDPEVASAFEALMSERFRSGVDDYVSHLVAGTPSRSRVHRRVFGAVRRLASVGKAVLIGRGAACLTRDLPGGVHVRLVAPKPWRVRRVAERMELNRVSALKWVEEQDADRARLVMTYFRRDIADPHLYDCVWSVDKVPVEAVVESVLSLVELRAQAPRPAAASAAG